MNTQVLTVLEVIIIALAMLIVPFVIWITHQLRNSILTQMLGVLNEHYQGLESLINRNKNSVQNLRTYLRHKDEIFVLKYNALVDKVEEIERYLTKTNGYRTRTTLPRLDSRADDDDSQVHY